MHLANEKSAKTWSVCGCVRVCVISPKRIRRSYLAVGCVAERLGGLRGEEMMEEDVQSVNVRNANGPDWSLARKEISGE